MTDAARDILGLELPPECADGVKENVEALARHFRLIEEFELPE
ncbi:hypothetical protein BH09PSE4_BH09PSE4_08370 [soil metagenome]